MSQPSVVLATASYDHTIRFWEAEIGRCYRTIQYPESQVNRVEITPDKCGIAAAGNPHIRLFDVNSNSSAGMPSYFAWELFSSQLRPIQLQDYGPCPMVKKLNST